jgi:error-prone DNA polymerase
MADALPPTPNCTAAPTSPSCAVPRIPEELVERAQALGYSALAITDEASLAGVVRAHKAASARGLKLIIGAEFRLASQQGPGFRLVLLAQNRAGYGNLSALITLARRRSRKGEYRLYRGDLETPGDFRRQQRRPAGLPGAVDPGPRRQRGRGPLAGDALSGPFLAGRRTARGPNDAARLAMLLELATSERPAGWSRPATCTCMCVRAARCRIR